MWLVCVEICSEWGYSIYASIFTQHAATIWFECCIWLTTDWLPQARDHFLTMPPRMQTQAFTPDSPSPVAAAGKKPTTSPAQIPSKGEALQKVGHTQVTCKLVDTIRTLEQIWWNNAIRLLHDSIIINDYNEHLLFLWGLILIGVHNHKFMQGDPIFKKFIPNFAAD